VERIHGGWVFGHFHEEDVVQTGLDASKETHELRQRAFREGVDGALGSVQRSGGAHNVLVVWWLVVFLDFSGTFPLVDPPIFLGF
jgi:hypothetical protein